MAKMQVFIFILFQHLYKQEQSLLCNYLILNLILFLLFVIHQEQQEILKERWLAIILFYVK